MLRCSPVVYLSVRGSDDQQKKETQTDEPTRRTSGSVHHTGRRSMARLAIADPPYLGRAVRWYGEGGCGNGRGQGQADNHPEAHKWDDPESHIQLVHELQTNYDGWAIAMSVHSLSTYLQVVETNSRNGIRVCVWHKPTAITSGSRITNKWEPVLIKVPSNRRGWKSALPRVNDVLTVNSPRNNFVGSKPQEWTSWVLDLMGFQPDVDTVDDLFGGSGAVSAALNRLF